MSVYSDSTYWSKIDEKTLVLLEKLKSKFHGFKF